MSGTQIQDKKIKVEISKRNKERSSTPGVYLGPSTSKRMRPRFERPRNYRSRSRSYRRRRYDSRDRSRPRKFMGSRSRSRSYSMRRR